MHRVNCSRNNCSFDCVGNFTPWSNCSSSCGTGFQLRTFLIETVARFGGLQCDHTNDFIARQNCSNGACDRSTSPLVPLTVGALQTTAAAIESTVDIARKFDPDCEGDFTSCLLFRSTDVTSQSCTEWILRTPPVERSNSIKDAFVVALNDYFSVNINQNSLFSDSQALATCGSITVALPVVVSAQTLFEAAFHDEDFSIRLMNKTMKFRAITHTTTMGTPDLPDMSLTTPSGFLALTDTDTIVVAVICSICLVVILVVIVWCVKRQNAGKSRRKIAPQSKRSQSIPKSLPRTHGATKQSVEVKGPALRTGLIPAETPSTDDRPSRDDQSTKTTTSTNNETNATTGHTIQPHVETPKASKATETLPQGQTAALDSTPLHKTAHPLVKPVMDTASDCVDEVSHSAPKQSKQPQLQKRPKPPRPPKRPKRPKRVKKKRDGLQQKLQLMRSHTGTKKGVDDATVKKQLDKLRKLRRVRRQSKCSYRHALKLMKQHKVPFSPLICTVCPSFFNFACCCRVIRRNH